MLVNNTNSNTVLGTKDNRHKIMVNPRQQVKLALDCTLIELQMPRSILLVGFEGGKICQTGFAGTQTKYED